jgi:hypothetical protein
MKRGDTFQALAQAFLEDRIDRRELVKQLAAIGIAIPAATAGFGQAATSVRIASTSCSPAAPSPLPACSSPPSLSR